MRRLLKYQSEANTGKTISGTIHIRHSLDNAIAKGKPIGSPKPPGTISRRDSSTTIRLSVMGS